MGYYYSAGAASVGSASAEDTFDRANATPMSTTMSDGVGTWQSGPGATDDVNISSNAASASSNKAGARVASPTFTGNHKAECYVGSGNGVFACARIQSDTNFTCYAVKCHDSSNTLRVYKLTDTGSGITQTQLGADVTITAIGTNNTYGISVSGTTISVLRQGSVVATRTDSDLSGGQPGIYFDVSGRTTNRFTAADVA